MTVSVGERLLRSMLPALAVALLVPLPTAAQAQGRETVGQRTVLQREIESRADKDLRPFYAVRQFRPLWLNEFGRPSAAATELLALFNSADIDGVDAKALRLDRVARLVDKARRGDEDDIAKADIELSTAFAAYVQAMRGVEGAEMRYESAALAPVVPTTRAALDGAALADSLDSYISTMGWMHPLYAPLREALADPRYTEDQREQIATNLARVRAIPAMPSGRHILVDASSATLWMYENDRVVDSMKVVVGKPELQTPMMAGFVRQAILNPYWQVPDDLVQNSIAANVLDRGVSYLRGGGYQVFADWSEEGGPLDPKKVDWHAVRDGTAKVHVRQLPGGHNFMGKVKFEFPNPLGIYLHDTPDQDLMTRDARQLSSGCVRMSDAPKMYRWLMGEDLPRRVSDPEQAEALPQIVPIYITYLTARPNGDQIVFQHDPYNRDTTQLAIAETGAAGQP